jgi:hypothetical protein
MPGPFSAARSGRCSCFAGDGEKELGTVRSSRSNDHGTLVRGHVPMKTSDVEFQSGGL